MSCASPVRVDRNAGVAPPQPNRTQQSPFKLQKNYEKKKKKKSNRCMMRYAEKIRDDYR